MSHTDLRALIRQFIFNYNMDTTAGGMDEERAMNDTVNLILAHITQQVTAAIEDGILIGSARELDLLWDGSHDRCGHETSETIRKRMIQLFGEKWSTDMYEGYIKRLAELQPPAVNTKED